MVTGCLLGKRVGITVDPVKWDEEQLNGFWCVDRVVEGVGRLGLIQLNSLLLCK